MNPLVSCLVLSYNNATLMLNTLNSVIEQTYANTELIIIDDGSSDNSVEVIERWIREKKVDCRLEVHPENWGISRSVDHAVSLSKGEYVAMVGDDIWLPQRLSVLMEEAERHPESAIIFSDCSLVDGDGNLIKDSFTAGKNIAKYGLAGGSTFHLILAGINPIAAPTAIVKRTCVASIGGYDTSLLTEDRDMWLRLTQRYPVSYVDLVLLKYIRHPGAFTIKQVNNVIWVDRMKTMKKLIDYNPQVAGTVLNVSAHVLSAIKENKTTFDEFNYWIKLYKKSKNPLHYVFGVMLNENVNIKLVDFTGKVLKKLEVLKV